MTRRDSSAPGHASLRHFVRVVSGSGFPVDEQGQSGLELPFFKVKDLKTADESGVLGTASDSITRETARDLRATIIPKGALAFAKVGAALLLGRVGALPADGCIDNNMSALIFESSFDPEFARYVMLTFDFGRHVLPGPVPSLDMDGLREFQVPVLSLNEQRAIADYLDRETAQIDALVVRQEEFIDLLRERRSGLIADRVTGRKAGEALDDNASWLGSPPAGWKLGQVKHFGDVSLGKMLQSNNTGSDVLASYMRAANVQPDGVLSLEDVKSMWFSPRELRVLDLRAGDVVVVEGGIGGYGRAGFIAESLDGWGFQNSINRIRPRADYDGRYLTYFLLMARQKGFIKVYCNIVSMPHLTAEKLEALPMFLPPPDEQRQIADHLDTQTARIDTLIAKAEEHIALAKERRAALITAAVTGQFDVRTARKAG